MIHPLHCISKFCGAVTVIYGLVLAFKASILLGILAIFVHSGAWAIGLIAVFGRPDLCQRIAEWMKFAF